jgi:SAM-dependent methyltransferase
MSPDGTSGNQVWTSPERTEILRREAELHSAASREETELLIRLARIGAGIRVLDLACGPGDPTLEVAETVGPNGEVVGVDLSAGALDVARERAATKGIHNARFETANAEALPFADGMFDRIVCRFGAMFFEDLPRAAREMRRVLGRNGRAALMVWGPFEQPHMQDTVGVVLRHLNLRAPPVEMSKPFRFADPSELVRSLQGAGFGTVEAEQRVVHWVWNGDPASALQSWRNGLVFWRSLVDQLPGGNDSPAWEEIRANYQRYFDGERIRVPLQVNVVTADPR